MNQPKMNVDWALKLLAEGGNESNGSGCLYMEVGRYKAWSMPVINALRRRGYQVERLGPGSEVFLLHPKQEQQA